MSYILEALKKSEQERRRGDVPDLQTVHLPVFAQHKSHAWPYIVIVFLLLVLAFVLGMVMMQQNDTRIAAAIPPQKIEPKTNNAATEPLVEQAAVVHTEPAVVTESVAVIESAPVVAIEQAPSLEMNSVPHLSQLPSLIQQAIPNMSFAGHVYSSNPIQRSVIINGHAMSEGDVVIDNLKVEQITRSGVVFNFDGQLFRMDILQDWSFE